MSRWNELDAIAEMTIDDELLEADEKVTVKEIYEKVKERYSLIGVSKAAIIEYIEERLSDRGNW